MKRVIFGTLLLTTTVLCFAAARPVCSERIYSEQDGRRSLYTCVMWETDAAGNVNVTVFYDDKTAWRGRGLADDVSSAAGFTLTIGGEAKDISTYFTKNFTAGSNVYQLKLIEGQSVPLGSVIKLTPAKNICWQTSLDDNGWAKKNFEYIYGTTCDATPVAEPGSSVCGKLLTSDTYDGDPNKSNDSRMLLSVQTYSDGSVHFDIASPADDVNTVFRRGEKSDALGGIACFTYGEGQPLSDYFTLSGEDNVTACVLTPVVGKTLPSNTAITYNGTIQWKTSAHPNAYARNQSFTFLYGTACASEPTDLHSEVLPETSAFKVIRNGQLIILTPSGMYSAQGQFIE